MLSDAKLVFEPENSPLKIAQGLHQTDHFPFYQQVQEVGMLKHLYNVIHKYEEVNSHEEVLPW